MGLVQLKATAHIVNIVRCVSYARGTMALRSRLYVRYEHTNKPLQNSQPVYALAVVLSPRRAVTSMWDLMESFAIKRETLIGVCVCV